jgi:hypothetical protein
MNSDQPSFERLEWAVTIIALHADYPGKQEAIAACLDDIEDRWLRGQLTLEQRLRLLCLLVRCATVPRRRDPRMASAI